MPDIHLTLPLSLSFGSSERLENQFEVYSSSETDDAFPHSRSNSLEFAEDLINKSKKERLYNPVQSLHLLSCGAKTLQKQALITTAIAFWVQLLIESVFTLQSFPFFQELSEKKQTRNKKGPEENDLIIYNFVNGSDEKSTICVDGEGERKGKERKNHKTETNPSHSPSTVETFARNVSPRSCNGNGDEEEDDDDERRKRKLTKTPCERNSVNPDKNDDDCDADDDATEICEGDGDNGTAVENHNGVEPDENADEICDEDDSMHDGVIDSVEEKYADIDGNHSEHDDDEEEENADMDDIGICHSQHSDNDDEEEEGEIEEEEENADDIDGAGDVHHVDQNTEGYDMSELAEMLHEASICNTEQRNVIEECREKKCYHMHLLLKHSRECKYRVLGGCEQCTDLRDVYIHHVTNCDNARCVIPKCREITEHLKCEKARIFENWRYKDDKVFFGEYFETTSGVDVSHSTHDDDEAALHTMPITQHEIDELIREVSLQSSEFSRLASRYSIDPWPPNEDSSEFSRSIVSRGVHRAPNHLSAESLDLERPAVVTILYPLNENYLGVQNGQYDDGFEWRKMSYLGQGSFGKCYLNTDLKSNKLFATKKIPLSKYDRNELEVWSCLNGNVRILELFGAIQTDQFVIIFMEYMEERSVAKLLAYQENGCLDENCSLYILREVLEGVIFLHSKNFVHCDIKGQNVFVNSTLTKVKLGDYGSAIQLHASGYTQVKMLMSTVYFMAPEACRSEQIGFGIDIWSCACLMVQMLTGNPPFYGFTGSVLYKVGNLKEPPPLPQCSEDVRDMLTDMFTLKPSERPSAMKLLQYQVFSEADCQNLDNIHHGCTGTLAPLSVQHVNFETKHSEQ